ncbi:MAG: hypothetical protein Q8O67_29545 [Deltaproteobacteria bacterium]|nr:hypothetical protein [Deltaproteobacteria bacterium]
MNTAVFSLDERLAPVFVVQMPARWPSDAALENALQDLIACSRHGAFAFVIDVRGAGKPQAAERSRIAKAIRTAARLYPGALRALAVVSHSERAKGVFLALDWLAPQRRHLRLFGDRAPAIAWARAFALGASPLRPLDETPAAF